VINGDERGKGKKKEIKKMHCIKGVGRKGGEKG